MEALRLSIVLFPLAAYLFLVGTVNSGRRPVLVTGRQDLSALAFGLSGMLIVLLGGLLPLDEFPRVFRYIAAGMVASGMAALVLFQRPRLVIYNLDPARFRELLPALVRDVEPNPILAGSHLTLPRLGVALQLESFPALRNVSLSAAEGPVSVEGWKVLHDQLVRSLGTVEVSPSRTGRVLMGMSFALLLAMPAWLLIHDPHGVAQAFRRIFEISFQ